ncbi:MAG TPA: hypothetical protein VD913_01995 [bacterium]|nr:hypothetical protein [bacterium]
MEKKQLYEKAEKAINQAFKAAQESMKVVSEKAGEAAHVTKLMVDKLTLEHRVSKQFAQLGNRIYEKALREGKDISLEDPDIHNLVEQTRKLDVELAQVEAALEREKREKADAKK